MSADLMTIAAAHAAYQSNISDAAALSTARLWQQVDPYNIKSSWASMLSSAIDIVSTAQLKAASDAMDYGTAALDSQGVDSSGLDLSASAFAGVAADGRTLSGLLSSPAYTALQNIGLGASVDQSMSAALAQIAMLTGTTVSDTGRAADSVFIASRKTRIGYVRMLTPPSCGRCAELAGRYYKWNSGFLRHPQCKCVHIPVGEDNGSDKRTNPYEYFKSLSNAEQDKYFTKSGAQALRDGADMSQVVNSRRGMSYGGLSSDGTKRGQIATSPFTREGTGKRGYFRGISEKGAQRLTPDAIYQMAGSRDEAIALLKMNGYVLPDGQVAGGVIRGQRSGYGQEGRGGQTSSVRSMINTAKRTGIRNAAETATMTAEERIKFRAMYNNMTEAQQSAYMKKSWDDYRAALAAYEKRNG